MSINLIATMETDNDHNIELIIEDFELPDHLDMNNEDDFEPIQAHITQQALDYDSETFYALGGKVMDFWMIMFCGTEVTA